MGSFYSYLCRLDDRSIDVSSLISLIKENNLEHAGFRGLIGFLDVDDKRRNVLLMHYVNYMNRGSFICYRQISTGGKSDVFLARPGAFNRTATDVAVKVVLDYKSDKRRFQSLMDEAGIMCRIEHPNIVYGYEAVSQSDLTYFVMEYVNGDNLERVVRNNGRIGQQHVLNMAKQMADAVGYLNECGYIHCDLKPSNFMLDSNGTIKLCDMGLSRYVNHIADSGNEIVGTMYYIAPELIRGRQCDVRCDIYSFGATLYHLLTGRPPFLAANTKELLEKHLKLKPVPLTSIDSSLNSDLCNIIERCLEKEPSARFSGFNELSERFKKLDNVFKTVTLDINSR